MRGMGCTITGETGEGIDELKVDLSEKYISSPVEASNTAAEFLRTPSRMTSLEKVLSFLSGNSAEMRVYKQEVGIPTYYSTDELIQDYDTEQYGNDY